MARGNLAVWAKECGGSGNGNGNGNVEIHSGACVPGTNCTVDCVGVNFGSSNGSFVSEVASRRVCST